MISKTIMTGTVILLLAAFTSFTQADVSHLASGNSAFPQAQGISEICLGCICEAISGCNTTLTCSGEVCGLFRITWAYWADAGKPTLRGEDVSSQTAYPNCVNDPSCAAITVKNYMTRFAQDCNDDGVVDCYDYAAIHKFGGYGCKGDLQLSYYNRLVGCLKTIEQLGAQ